MDANQNYTVVVAGMGKRGTHHADAFQKNGRFRLVGLCDIDATRLETAAKKFGVSETSADAAVLVKKTRPDIFCFCTLPDLRLPLIRAGVEAGAKLIAYEKPTALSTNEALVAHHGFHARGGRENRGEPPAPLWGALQEGEGDHIERRNRPRAHRLRHRHRLDDAYAHAPHRLHAMV